MRNFLPIGKKVKHKVSSVLHAATQDSLPCHPDTEFHCGLFLFFFFFYFTGESFIALVGDAVLSFSTAKI